jgi:hypothetical protein
MATTPTSKATPPRKSKAVIALGADLSPAVASIEAAYRMFQRAYPDAPPVTIVVKRDEKAWGHTTVAKVWAPSKRKDQAADRFEIMISGENLRRGGEAVAATLLHEAAHARNLARGILDTDSNGRHNMTFKATAEEHGLQVEADRWHGWTSTSFTDEGRARWRRLIATIDRGLAKAAAVAPFSVDHLPKVEGEGEGAKVGPKGRPVRPVRPVAPPKRGNRNLLKAVCGCGHSIRASRGVIETAAPTCSVCSEPFEVVE